MKGRFKRACERAAIRRQDPHDLPCAVWRERRAGKTAEAIGSLLHRGHRRQFVRRRDGEDRCRRSHGTERAVAQLIAADTAGILQQKPAIGPQDSLPARELRKDSSSFTGIVNCETIREKQHGIRRNSGDCFERQIGAGKQHVGIACERAERASLDGERLPLPRSGIAAVMHDGRGLGREMKRGVRADADVKGEPVARVKSTRRRLQIERQKLGPRRVEMEAARDMQGIADPLAAQRGPPAGKIDRKMGFDVAPGAIVGA